MSSTAAFRPLTPALGSSTVISPPLAPDTTRLASLDIFRGATIAMMLLVNNPGGDHSYAPLDHAPWDGWTVTDLVFPFFLFIMGVAIPFSLGKRAQAESKGSLFLHILARGLSLFVLGELGYAIPYPRPGPSHSILLTLVRIVAVVFLGASLIALLYPWKSKRLPLVLPPVVALLFTAALFAMHFVNQHALAAHWIEHQKDFGGGILNPDAFRIPGILQRIGVCYMIAAALALAASWHVLTFVVIVFLGTYSWLMLKMPYPSLREPHLLVHGLLDKADNLARFVDTRVLGGHVYANYPDPEGIVSTISAVVTALLGVLAGIWLRTARPAIDRCAGLLAVGVAVTCVGGVMGTTLMPINKSIWTSSFAVFCAGLGMLGLGVVFYIADVLRYRRWAMPFTVYGMNAITAFVLSSIVGRLLLIIHMPDPETGKSITVKTFLAARAARVSTHFHLGNAPDNASLAYALAYVLFFLILMSIFYKLKIFLKV